ncbi:MAG: DUF503 domain-containing protein [Nitrospinaceae bacterium]|jgi:hypothetical protein|nr:DUF503 domain-containing protein [Nitrospinaceae bacterium]MBT3433150.1 DUF503 domain-containing protein [Nitrospinaceae bacterium]MBT3821924.1 DUF503 domain-containing protein [Nitrospinaceae bacterium]MBT4094351.1 DUF503 domain-containing protein [Nitrospinaceae bacterium]MBT4429458.1 DUF503 domain-containing protein [Nitrospinaceae bacterium]
MTAVGLLSVDLHIPESRSLKAKRKVVQSIIAKLRQRFNVAVAEVEFQDKWQRCKLGVSAVSNSGSHVDEQLRSALDSIEDMVMGRAVILDYDIEIL